MQKSLREKLVILKNHQGFLRYATNTSWLLCEKVVRLIAGLFVGIWVARYLGPEKFGLLSYAQSFVGLFAAFATLGLDGIVVRELVKDQSRKFEVLGTAFWLKFMGGFAVLLILYLAINSTSTDDLTRRLVFIIASGTVMQSFNVIDFYFQSKVLSRYVVFANIISLFASSVIKVILILNNASLEAFAWTVLFDSIILSLGFLYYFLKHSSFQIKNLKFKSQIAHSLLKDSWPLILSGVVVSIYMRIDQVMIKNMMDNEAVGQYAAAVRISELWYFIPTVLTSSLFPAIINAKAQNEKLYYERLQKLFDLMVFISLSIAAPMTFFSNWFVNLLYGEEYYQAGNVLMIHIWSGVFVFLGVASGSWYITENLQKLSFWRAFYGMIINLFLNLILIPKYGIKGAAVATLFGQIMSTYIFDFYNSKTKNMFYMKSKSFFLVKSIKRIFE